MGATVAACRKENQPKDAPAAPPKAYGGNRADPPDTGYIPPSSACTRARTSIATPPITQEITAAGPAVTSPFCPPKSQPEPMIDPVEAHSSPIRPISRFSDAERIGGCSSLTTAMSSSSRRARSNRGGRPPSGGAALLSVPPPRAVAMVIVRRECTPPPEGMGRRKVVPSGPQGPVVACGTGDVGGVGGDRRPCLQSTAGGSCR